MEADCIHEVRKAMSEPAFYPHPVTAVELRETHISVVFLTGTYAYKIKKPVDLGFLDFTTLEKRRHYCWQELLLNRRLSDNVYLDVIAVTADELGLAMNGKGPVVEYAVKMRQLPDDLRMDRLVQKKEIDDQRICTLASRLFGFYDRAPCGHEIANLGAWETVRVNCEENFRQTESVAGKFFNAKLFKIVQAATLSFLHRRQDLFQKRCDSGKIRDCHGDLKVEHIYFENGLQIIDCIEFNDRFRYSDTSADLAFLVMDLDFKGFSDIGAKLLSAYVLRSHDRDMFVLMDFYKCYRACVRIKVNCLRLQDGELAAYERHRLERDTLRYLELAYRYAVQFSRQTVWVVCGMPATGKSSLGQALGQALGAIVFNSDAIRKALFGLAPTQQQVVPFQAGIYSNQATSRTYSRLCMLAYEELKKGHSVILDASFSKTEQRREVMRLAKDMDCQLIFVECRACLETIRKRLLQRESRPEVSDARLSHLHQFQRNFEPLEEIEEDIHLQVDTQVPIESNIQQILARANAILFNHAKKALNALKS
jgi:aminoglycoside phosphotransferase family enzyme/predicted kinase